MNPVRRHYRILSYVLCLVCAAFLLLSFPNVDCGPLIWIAMVPWFWALDGQRKHRAFGLSYLTGLIFFTLALYWIMFVTVLGAVLLFLYLALYFGLFGWAYVFFARSRRSLRFVVLPSVWVALEFTRGHLMSGFGWLNLAHSQHHNWLLIQMVDITGVYGVSFLIVLVNLLIKENLQFMRMSAADPAQDRRGLVRLNVVVLVVLLGVFSYGGWRVSHRPVMDTIKIGLVQGNIPQDEKWIFDQREAIIAKYLALSEKAAVQKPDLLIWPETAFPGMAAETPELMERIREFVRRSSVPLLLGIVTENNALYYNSAVLVSTDGQIADQYDKIHLVPFGEYLPFRRYLPFLVEAVGIEDFSSGRDFTVLHQQIKRGQESRPVSFSALICFEDTLAHLARPMVRNGAQFLINITNDAWFEDSNEPFMHLQASLFRSVETKRSLVRAANTGVSCGIDPYGRILNYIQDKAGKKTYIDGIATFGIPLNREQTIYTKIGDVFTYLCFLCILWAGYIRKIAN